MQFSPKEGGGNSQGVPGALHHRAGWRLANPQREGHAQHAFAADQPHFQRPMGIQFRHQGDEAGKREIGVTVRLVCLAKNAAEDQLYRFAMIEDPVALSARNAIEKMVGHCGSALCPAAHGNPGRHEKGAAFSHVALLRPVTVVVCSLVRA
ncbi:hypothetical protein D9M72_334940 [compost metagenome]